ncbi:MAG: TrmH family RNA methyltransferase [Lentisphaeria bacterium]|jgi:tRNA G18 (ribose-2'-O)-methylase SpoU
MLSHHSAAAPPPPPEPRIRTGDRSAPGGGDARLPVRVVLDRLRSAYNVGNIFRLAEAVGAEGIVACGYTAAPPHPKLAKTARGCDQLVPCETAPTAAAAVADLNRRGYAVYIVETVEGARPPWAVPFRFPAAFVFGNEALGCAPETLADCAGVVALPARGRKNSINVANCAAVVLYAALRQWLVQPAPGGNAG